MNKLLKNLYTQEWFRPGLIGLFFNPYYFARKGLFNGLSQMQDEVKGDILDVGCGQKPYKQLFKTQSYIGLEIDTEENRLNKNADFFYDGKTFPFKDKTFDCVICNQVLEHVFNPDEFLSEMTRVLKQQGRLLLTVPFVWDEHEQPYDYARYSSFGLNSLLKKNGFQTIKQEKTMADIRAVIQIINAYLFKIFPKNKILKFILVLLFIAPFNILGVLSFRILPKNNDLYLDNILIAEKITR